MDANLDGLADELSALTQRFADLGARLGDAARGLGDAGAPPPDGLVDDLEGARAQFIQLRSDVLTAAHAASIPPKGEPESLTDLEPLLGAIAGFIRQQAAQAALHVDVVEPARAAGDAPPVLAAPPAEPPPIELEIAAPPPVPEPATLVVDQPVTMPTIEMPSLTLEPPEPQPAPVAAAPPPPKSAGPSKAATPSRPAAPSKPAAASKAATPAVPAAEPSAPDETAQWWLAAWARWSGWKATHDFAGVVRDEIGKYPYLLSVPIQKSPEYEEGLLAYGYSILIDHAEKQNPGCVGNALNSLKAGVARPVGEQLYDYLVSEGRLRESYPEFVKNALVAAVPEPGLWFQFRILESKEDTRIFQRPSARLGDSELAGQRLASDAQRYAEHKFKMTLPPLTLRCVLVSGDSIREARGIGVKLLADGAASESAWIATVAAGGRGKTDARRVGGDGTHIPGLGKDYASVWIAVFNPEPAADRRYELSVFLRKDSKSPFRRAS